MKESQFNVTDIEDPKMGLIGRRLAAIDRARQNIERITKAQNKSQERSFLFWSKNKHDNVLESSPDEFHPQPTEQERMEQRRRTRRVKEVDALIQSAQKQLMQLACEKDLLQQRPNPLWNYTATSATENTENVVTDSDKENHNDTIGNTRSEFVDEFS